MIDDALRESFRTVLGLWSKIDRVTRPTEDWRRRELGHHPRRLSVVYTMDAGDLVSELEKYGYDEDEQFLIPMLLGSWNLDSEVESQIANMSSRLIRDPEAVLSGSEEDLDPWQLDGRTIFDEAVRLGVLSILRTRKPIRWLYNSAQNGQEEDILAIAEIDKGAIGEGEMGIWIQRRQINGDWKFLRQLGRRLGKELVIDDLKLNKVDFLVAMFWAAGLWELTWEALRDFLAEEGLVHRDYDPRELAKRLRAQGMCKEVRLPDPVGEFRDT